jgi:hypothetical protein
MVERDAEVAGVLVTIVVRVPDEGTLEQCQLLNYSMVQDFFLDFTPTFQWSWN